MKLPHEKLGLSELAYLMAYSQGYRKAPCGYRNTTTVGAALRKAYNQGRRDAKKF